MARSLNRVQLIGNLTRDPELRYTPNGNAVCSFGLATNRSWKTDTGEKHEEAEFHNVVAWNKLAEICSQFLVKGRKVFLEGRLSTRNWTAQDGTQRNKTEIVISDMILLDSRRSEGETANTTQREDAALKSSTADVKASEEISENPPQAADVKAKKAEKKEESKEPVSDEVAPDDIPF